MNRVKLSLPEEMPFSGYRNDTTLVSDHNQNTPTIIAEAVATRQLSCPMYQPTSHDILCGRGRGRFLHQGNKVYLSLLRTNIAAYMVARKRSEKSTIINTVVSSLKGRGFRFLKEEENKKGWYELSGTECYERTARALRDLIRKHRGGGKKRKPNFRSPPSGGVSFGVTSEAKVGRPINHDRKEIGKSMIPLLPDQVFRKDVARFSPLSINATDRPTEHEEDYFDGQIQRLPSEVMSPTDTLKADTFDVLFEIPKDDFETILAQLEKDKPTRQDSR